MTVLKEEEEVAVKMEMEENPALGGENAPLSDEADTGDDDEDVDDEEETDSDGDYENPRDHEPQLKKGPWTPEEDKRLKDYVEAHGEGNWNRLQRNAGLNRCGKSCRLRWANHLRPDLKKGPFDADEVEKIIRFHIMWGNKWAKMASHLPGRTDNEIKNYWNTRLKRNQRHNLPVYPEYMLSRVTHPHQDMNHETPGESHGKKRLKEYSKEKVVGVHDLTDNVMTFQHLDYDKDPVVPSNPLKRHASTGSIQIPIASSYPVELPSNQSYSYTPSNEWLFHCPSASIEHKSDNLIHSPDSILSQTTGLLGASIHNSDILDDPIKSGRCLLDASIYSSDILDDPIKSGTSVEIPVPEVYPMMHSSVFGDSEHEGCPITKIQTSDLSSGSDAVFNLSQCYPVASFSDLGIPDAPLDSSFLSDIPPPPFNDTPLEALKDQSHLFFQELKPLTDGGQWLKDQSHLFFQESKPLTDGGQWFDHCHKRDFPSL